MLCLSALSVPHIKHLLRVLEYVHKLRPSHKRPHLTDTHQTTGCTRTFIYVSMEVKLTHYGLVLVLALQTNHGVKASRTNRGS